MDYDEKAEQWFAENPDAWAMFSSFCWQAAYTGRRFGAKAVAERIRWETLLRTNTTFKWNNNYTAWAARKWATENPNYAHLLSFRGPSAPDDEPVYRDTLFDLETV